MERASTATLIGLAVIIFLIFAWLAVRTTNYPTWIDSIPTSTPTPPIGYPMEDFETPTASRSATTVTVFPSGGEIE